MAKKKSTTGDSGDPKPRPRGRRGKGEGSVWQRPDGRWEARIDVGCDATGKRIIRSVYGRLKQDVTKKLTDLAKLKNDGGLTATGKLTVGDFLDRWHENARSSVAPNTHNRYESLLRLHIKPHCGRIKLSAINQTHIVGLMANLERSGAGEETRRYCLQVLRTAFNVAVDWDLIGRNPCNKVKPPKVSKRKILPLEPPQIKSLITAANGHRLKAVFVVAITTGLRQGEIFALHWDDVDLTSGTIAVRFSLEESKGQLRLKEPKSDSGRRMVRIPLVTVDALQVHKDEQAAEGLEDCPTVFCDHDGGFLRKSNFERRAWKPIRKAAGIPDTVTFHDLRHTAASLLIKAGSHPKVIQELLGHSTIKLSMDKYGHLMRGMQDEAAGHFDTISELRIQNSQSIVSQNPDSNEKTGSAIIVTDDTEPV